MKTLTNLEFKRDGQKNNAIVSRETLGESKQIKALQETNGAFKYETADGITTLAKRMVVWTLTIDPTGWVEITDKKPFKYKFDTTMFFQSYEIVTLINDNPVLFNTFGFQIESNDLGGIDLYALKKPPQVNIKLRVERWKDESISK